MDFVKISTKNKEELIDITNEVEKRIKSKTGICCIFLRHASAGLYINENESGLKEDFLNLLNKIIPNGKGYKHNKHDNNATAHLKASLLGQSVFVPLKEGKLMLGTWQRIFLAEFDGPREREIIVDAR